MSGSYITSRDGTRLAYTTSGDPNLPAIVLLHGWSQHLRCWAPLMARLQDRFHLVAIDLRGHGGSDKPDAQEAYTDTSLWGDDVKAVIDTLSLHRPTLVGWSYGARVIAAYLATHGDDAISGIVLAGGILAIGEARGDWMVGDSSPGLDPDLYTNDLSRRLPATARFVEACTATPLPRPLYAETVGANMLCPAHVRRALFKATVDFAPTFAAMKVPGLVIHGTEDRVVTPATGEAAAACMPRGRYLPYAGIGHIAFLEAPDSFANDLAHFVTDCHQEAAHA